MRHVQQHTARIGFLSSLFLLVACSHEPLPLETERAAQGTVEVEKVVKETVVVKEVQHLRKGGRQ
jgi:starvation-inducible outer membrane lipoprotein